MKYAATIERVERGRGGLTLFVRTQMGIRGIDVDSAVWTAIRADYDLVDEQELVGWEIEYDPEHGDLEVMGPPDDLTEDAQAGSNDRLTPE